MRANIILWIAKLLGVPIKLRERDLDCSHVSL